MERSYNIAGLTVNMDTFGRTLDQSRPYLCAPAEPDITIRTQWRTLQKEQPHLSDEDCEYMQTGTEFYKQLLRQDGIMLHASCVVVDNRSYLFSAPSGTGKSTHTQLWLKKFGPRAYLLNDDKPALRRIDNTWYAFGTPWSGKCDLSVNGRAPVAGICFLSRGDENRIAPITGAQAVFSFLEQTVRPADRALRETMLELLEDLLDHAPVWQLSCNMDPASADLAYDTMSSNVL